MQTNSPHRFDTYCENPWSTERGGFIAVTAGPYYIRVVHAVSNGVMLNGMEAPPAQIKKVLNFVRTTKRDFPEAKLVGDRHERWPDGLHAALVQEFGPFSWVPAPLLKRAAPDYRRSTRVLKFVRATFLAACAAYDAQHSTPNTDIVLASWKRALLTEIAFHLDTGPPPPIPF